MTFAACNLRPARTYDFRARIVIGSNLRAISIKVSNSSYASLPMIVASKGIV
jgi:hypothetical protein